MEEEEKWRKKRSGEEEMKEEKGLVGKEEEEEKKRRKDDDVEERGRGLPGRRGAGPTPAGHIVCRDSSSNQLRRPILYREVRD